MGTNHFHEENAPGDAGRAGSDDEARTETEGGTDADAVLAMAAAIVAAVHPAQSAFVPQRKRMNRALADLGVLDLLGTDWIDVDAEADTVTFRPIDRSRLDALVRRLEDHAAGVREEPARPGPGQQSFALPPSVPSAPVDRSTFHVEVDR